MCDWSIISSSFIASSHHLFQQLCFCLSPLSTYKVSDHVNAGFTSNAIYQTPWVFQEHGPHSTQSIVMLFRHQEHLFPLKFNQPFQVSRFIREESRVDIEQKSAAWLQESVSETKVHNNTQLHEEMDFLVWCERPWQTSSEPWPQSSHNLWDEQEHQLRVTPGHLTSVGPIWGSGLWMGSSPCSRFNIGQKDWNQGRGGWCGSQAKACDSALKWSAHECIISYIIYMTYNSEMGLSASLVLSPLTPWSCDL